MSKHRSAVSSRLMLLTALTAVVGTGGASAATVLASADTFITKHGDLGGPSANWGSATFLYNVGSDIDGDSWTTRTLVKFDLAAFAGQTVLEGATVTFSYVSSWPSPSFGVALHQVLIDWQEDVVTWNNFGPTPGVQLGVDAATEAFAAGTYSPTSPLSLNIPSSLIQSWIDDPTGNHGLLLYTSGRDLSFHSKESATGAGPTLTFSVVPEPSSTLALGLLIGSGLCLRSRRKPSALP